MSSGGTIGGRSAVSRADLLRALAAAPRDDLALDIDEAGWFGYVRQEEPSRPVRIEPPAGAVLVPIRERRLPLRMSHAYAAVRQERRAPAEIEAVAEAERVIREPIDAASAKPQSQRRLIDYEDLVPQARLLPALRRRLGATRGGLLDLERIVERLAAGRIPRRLPRRSLRRWNPDLVVVLDFSSRLWPYRADMHCLAERLLRQCGRGGVSLRIFNRGPFASWTDWLEHQNPNAEDEPPEKDWKMPLPGTPVLIASDLGLLLGRGSPLAKAWVGFIKALKRAQTRPMALAPVGAQQLDGALTEVLPVLRWSPDAPAHPARGHGEAQAEPEGLADLLAMVAAARRVDPPLLRAMRKLIPVSPLDAGLEGAVWCHADVEAGFAAALRTESQQRHLDRFHRRLPDLHVRLDALRRAHHAHLPVSLAHEETLLWWDHAATDARETPEARQRLQDALAFMERLAQTVTASPGVPRAEGDWTAVAQGILRRAENTAMPKRHPQLHRLAAAVRAVRGDAAVPGWVDPAAMARVLEEGAPVRCWLVQDAERGSLRLQAEPTGPRQVPLGEALTVDAGGVRVSGNKPGADRWLSAPSLPADLAPLTAPATLHIETATEILEVAAVRRPRGVGGWRCGRDGIEVVSPPLAGHRARWQAESLLAVLRPDAAPETVAPALEGDVVLEGSEGAATLRFGIDARFGVFADVSLATKHGNATQRLRWIEPGTFLMGSPEDEPERESDEGPQHPVTISKGFWLADTACMQGLWQAVMGGNPSRFDDPEQPVESVSWHDVQEFLRRLEALLPGCHADLPAEAEWEYACRAGTTTPFSFGERIATEEVNYNGNYPYADGTTEQYRRETVPVKSLPPNPWGLYEMHGNVWEWCADGLRTYDGEPQVDPRGPEDAETPRAYRGGCWIFSAGIARSACRDADPLGFAYSNRGFRLCLRSIEPGQLQGRPGGPAERAASGRPPR